MILIEAYEIEYSSLIPLEDWPEGRSYKGINPPDGFGFLHGIGIKPLLFEEDPGSEEAEKRAIEAMTSNRGHLLHLEVRRLVPAPWHLTWFAHLTLRLGRTDAELLSDFERFVRRSQLGGSDPDDLRDAFNQRSLMGAEDRWRWKMCNCEGCKGRGEVIIGH